MLCLPGFQLDIPWWVGFEPALFGFCSECFLGCCLLGAPNRSFLQPCAEISLLQSLDVGEGSGLVNL